MDSSNKFEGIFEDQMMDESIGENLLISLESKNLANGYYKYKNISINVKNIFFEVMDSKIVLIMINLHTPSIRVWNFDSNENKFTRDKLSRNSIDKIVFKNYKSATRIYSL